MIRFIITSFPVWEQLFAVMVMVRSIGELLSKHIIPVISSLVILVWSSKVMRLLKEHGRPPSESIFAKVCKGEQIKD